MLLGILADTHDEFARTERAVELLRSSGAEALIHCGDLASPPIVAICSALPCWFVLGNHDADSAPALRKAAADFGAVCLDWGGVVDLAGRRIGIAHGHMRLDIQRVLAEQPDYLLTGHMHFPIDTMQGSVRRINPGALFRADEFSVGLLELESDKLEFLRIG